MMIQSGDDLIKFSGMILLGTGLYLDWRNSNCEYYI